MKKFILVIISAIMLVSLVSCAETSAKNSVEKFFDAYKNMDLSKANEYVEGTGLLQKSIKQFEDYDKERIDALKYWGSNINYKILSKWK